MTKNNPFACPECGTALRSTLEDNGERGLDLTLRCSLCPEEDAPEWDPAERLADICPDWNRGDDRQAIRLWWEGQSWESILDAIEGDRRKEAAE